MATSRSTPRVRFLATLLCGATLLVAVSTRPTVTGVAGELAQALGLACVALAALWRVWCSVFIAGQKDISLVQDGPYSACRHPLYAATLLALLGCGLLTRSALISGTLVAAGGVLHWRALRSEDEVLAGLHGKAFAEYRARVPALWPDWRLYQVPVVTAVRARVLWKAFLDAASLLGAAMLLLLTDRLQNGGWLPSLLQLP